MPKASAARSAERRATASITPETTAPLVDLEFVRGLIQALDESSLDSLEISRAGTRIRMAKSPPAPMVNGVAPATMAMVAPAAHPSPHAAPAAAPAAGEARAAEVAPAAKSNLIDVKSPMVGTFYRAPAPEAPPYCEIGSTVRKGQTLCILEAMKLMNELECEVDGVVREVLAENADPVEYGQVLFRIEPA